MECETVQWSDADLQLFSEASHDHNPLHLADGYAHRTSFGEPVVFGVLVALAALSKLGRRPGQRLTRLVLEFPRAALRNTLYQIEMGELVDSAITFGIYDGTQVLTRGTAQFAAGTSVGLDWPSNDPGEPIPRDSSDSLAPGLTAEGHYAPSSAAWKRLMEKSRVGQTIGEVPLAALLWSSYFTGMEVPGERALFFRLSIEFFWPDASAIPLPFPYQARVVSYDPRVQLIRSQFQLGPSQDPWARGELRAFVRSSSTRPAASAAALANMTLSNRLKGRVAVVTGASRGLGASLVQRLALEGCTVFGTYRKSAEEAEQLVRDLPGGAGPVVMLQGDAGDLGFCTETAGRIMNEGGRVDFLFLNASPPLLPLWLEPEHAVRLVDYVTHSVSVAVFPLVAFLRALDQSQGWVILSSSLAIDLPPAQWPHYVAAKMAAEGFVRTAAAEYSQVSFLLARFPRLATNFAGDTFGSSGLAPEDAIVPLVKRLLGDPIPGQVEVLEGS